MSAISWHAAIIPWRGKGRILDVGCGTGLELVALREKGWTVRGIELSEKAVSEARRVHGLDVLCGRLKDRLFEPASFDVITFGNSLEHVHSPRLTLVEARRVLDPHGLLVIKVPNIDSWSAKIFDTRWFQLDVPRHLYHFTPKTMRELLRRTGFRVIRETFDVGATYGIRESLRWKCLYEGKPDFKNRKIYEICFWWMNAIACLFRRGEQLIIFAEPAEK
ncbi:MAG: class I SAM-dependent methyltransferase [Candidatus Omnitrophica bacterium]|nr:class I SAM-dependent methyltransferase [Candidatus Omnitrophota bacterium]